MDVGSLLHDGTKSVTQSQSEFFAKLSMFENALLREQHPRYKLPPEEVEKLASSMNSPSFPFSFTSKAANPTDSEELKQLDSGVSLSARSASPKPSQTAAPLPFYASFSQPLAAPKPIHPSNSASAFDPVLLTKSEDLIKAEINLKRLRIEKLLKTGPAKPAKDSTNEPDVGTTLSSDILDASQVLNAATALIQPISGFPSLPKRRRSPDNSSVGENRYYSSKVDSSSTFQTENLPRGGQKVQTIERSEALERPSGDVTSALGEPHKSELVSQHENGEVLPKPLPRQSLQVERAGNDSVTVNGTGIPREESYSPDEASDEYEPPPAESFSVPAVRQTNGPSNTKSTNNRSPRENRPRESESYSPPPPEEQLTDPHTAISEDHDLNASHSNNTPLQPQGNSNVPDSHSKTTPTNIIMNNETQQPSKSESIMGGVNPTRTRQVVERNDKENSHRDSRRQVTEDAYVDNDVRNSSAFARFQRQPDVESSSSERRVKNLSGARRSSSKRVVKPMHIANDRAASMEFPPSINRRVHSYGPTWENDHYDHRATGTQSVLARQEHSVDDPTDVENIDEYLEAAGHRHNANDLDRQMLSFHNASRSYLQGEQHKMVGHEYDEDHYGRPSSRMTTVMPRHRYREGIMNYSLPVRRSMADGYNSPVFSSDEWTSPSRRDPFLGPPLKRRVVMDEEGNKYIAIPASEDMLRATAKGDMDRFSYYGMPDVSDRDFRYSQMAENQRYFRGEPQIIENGEYELDQDYMRMPPPPMIQRRQLAATSSPHLPQVTSHYPTRDGARSASIQTRPPQNMDPWRRFRPESPGMQGYMYPPISSRGRATSVRPNFTYGADGYSFEAPDRDNF